MFLHGSIHLLGFVKAFQLAEIKTLTEPISKPAGVIYLLSFLLFWVVALLYLLRQDNWWLLGLLSVVISQILVLYFWQDAKFGTVVNIIILLVVIADYGSWKFENSYKKEIQKGIQRTEGIESPILVEEELQLLPKPVQKYLRYVGVVGKPKVNNVSIVFEGEMREKGKDWFTFRSEQYNFYDEPERLFFMKAKINGLATHGFHSYKNGSATMLIKLLSLFSVVDLKGKELGQAETVTFLNDMCLFAPATLIDKRIHWDAINDTTAKATFTNKGISISANLIFNSEGQLIDFVSHDRYAASDSEMEKYPFSTPVQNYGKIGGLKLFSYGEAVWHYPEGKFTYGKFRLKSIEYNITTH